MFEWDFDQVFLGKMECGLDGECEPDGGVRVDVRCVDLRVCFLDHGLPLHDLLLRVRRRWQLRLALPWILRVIPHLLLTLFLILRLLELAMRPEAFLDDIVVHTNDPSVGIWRFVKSSSRIALPYRKLGCFVI